MEGEFEIEFLRASPFVRVQRLTSGRRGRVVGCPADVKKYRAAVQPRAAHAVSHTVHKSATGANIRAKAVTDAQNSHARNTRHADSAGQQCEIPRRVKIGGAASDAAL
jgi:hypothetical protein